MAPDRTIPAFLPRDGRDSNESSGENREERGNYVQPSQAGPSGREWEAQVLSRNYMPS